MRDSISRPVVGLMSTQGACGQGGQNVLSDSPTRSVHSAGRVIPLKAEDRT